VDFGANLPMPTGWPRGLVALLRAARDGDTDALAGVVTRAGLIADDRLDRTALMETVGPLVEPLRQPEFSFSRTWLRGQTARFSDPRSVASRTERGLAIPPRFLLVQRVAAGTTGVLCSLGATVPLRAEAARWLPGLRT
jgi:hypothetical protein